MNKRQLFADMTDAEILQKAGHGKFGPALIGQDLFEVASDIMARTAGGRFGPAIANTSVALETVSPEVWEGWRRNALLAIAREHELPVKANWSRDALADALAAAGVTPPPEAPEAA